MELVPYVAAYIAIGIFAVAVAARFFMWRKLPLHIRWELYPVAHEAPSRAKYGGSYLEEQDWWRKPRESSLMGELKVMLPEILFLVALKEHNPKLWTRSFPFHLGLYLVIGCTSLMILNGLLVAVLGSPSVFLPVMDMLVAATGYAGLVLGILGALGLLERRLNDPALKDFTAAADLFNLAIFVVAFGLALVSVLMVSPNFGYPQAFINNLVTFNMASLGAAGLATLLPMATVLALGAVVAYIPMTHMSHFVGKFFAYHAIRWNDEPNLRGGHEEGAIGQVLNYPVSWSADHIKGDGKKTWADVATEDMKE